MAVLSDAQKKQLEVALGSKKADGVPSPAASAVAGAAKAQTVAAIATVDASDLATAIALANASKAKINEILSALSNG